MISSLHTPFHPKSSKGTPSHATPYWYCTSSSPATSPTDTGTFMSWRTHRPSKHTFQDPATSGMVLQLAGNFQKARKRSYVQDLGMDRNLDPSILLISSGYGTLLAIRLNGHDFIDFGSCRKTFPTGNTLLRTLREDFSMQRT